MPRRHFSIDLVVFSAVAAKAPAPEDVLKLCEGRLAWRRITRQNDPGLFVAPVAVPADAGSLWAPFSETRRAEVSDLVASAVFGWRILSDAEADDLSPLQLAVGLACSILQNQEGLAVIDQTSGLGYTASGYYEIADLLSDCDDINFWQHVRLVELERAASIDIQTRGLRKFGHRDLKIEELPRKYREFGIWLLGHALGKYPALDAVLGPGQDFAYTRANPYAKLYFVDQSDGTLLVTDCHPKRKESMSGLATCLATLYPTYLVERHGQSAGEAKEEVEPRIHTFDQYVAFSRLLHDGRVGEAMASYGVSWKTLGAVSYQWTRRVTEANLGPEFNRRLFES